MNEDLTAEPELAEDVPQLTRKVKNVGQPRILVLIIAAMAFSVLIRVFAFQTFYVPSGSMEPTLWPGDRIVVDKLSVEFGTIHRGDIVVFRAPSGVKSQCGDSVSDLVKRVIGLPGDHLTAKGNQIFVNGKLFSQRWSVYPSLAPRPLLPTTVLANHYFMMGDNHPYSCDSRFWGSVPRSSIIGKVFIRIWPLKDFHWF